MAKKCDNTSVGVLIYNDRGDTLMNERMKYPFGFAPPAGHLDGDEPEDGAKREIKEEVGLEIDILKLVMHRKLDNLCRREGGDWHDWHVYGALRWHGDVKRSEDETKQVIWLPRSEIGALAERTTAYLLGAISEKEWQEKPGLEVVWYEIFKILEII